MRKLEIVLTLCGVLLMALAAVLLVTHSRVAVSYTHLTLPTKRIV